MRQLGAPLAVALAAALCLAAASDPAERLPDPTQEARARALFQEVRCMVCQNESIADSEAGLAVDLRRLVRERIASGQDDAQVRSWLVDRYGEFVLLRPSFSWANLALWLAPLAVVIAGVLALAARLRQPAPADAALSEAEARRLSDLLAGTDGHDPALKSSRDDPNA